MLNREFERLFDENYGPVRRYLARRVGEHTAEDLAADTFLTAYRAWSRFDPTAGSARSWLFGIATNVLRHQTRQELRTYRAVANARLRPEVADAPDGAVVRQVDAERLVRSLAVVLAELDPRDRDVLLLSAWAHLSNVEIAAALDIPAGTVGSRLHRVRELARAQMQRVDGEQIHD